MRPQRPAEDPEAKLARALDLWSQARPIAGTLAERYLAETRRIDVAGLPANISDSLRFHPSLPVRTGALSALPARPHARPRKRPDRSGSTAPRFELQNGRVCKIDRFALGRDGRDQALASGSQLIVGEGLETTLAAATRIPYRGAPLQPAWSAVSSGGLSRLPVIPGVERLIILVDHDGNGEGQAAAVRCMERWTRAGRTVIRLTPKRVDADFNDLVLPEPGS